MKIIYKKTTMKKNLLLMMLCIPVVLSAQNGNGVTVSNLAVDAGTVTFNVSWDKNNPSDTVWVFVDYNDAGVMRRLQVTNATVSAGTVTKTPNNNKGVWVEGNARTEGSFSATVKLLTATADLAGACAYASNCPPVGEYNATEISFTGTPEYKVVLERNDKSTYTVTVGKDESLLIPSGEVVLSFTDKTGAPGRLKPIPPPYAASVQIWTVGTQIWSDAINDPACDHEEFTSSTSDPYCRSYSKDGPKWYLYNWPYVNANQNTLCPSPWRVPNKNDFIDLDNALGGDGTARSGVPLKWITDTYINVWGGEWYYGTYLANISNEDIMQYHSSDPDGNGRTFNLRNHRSGTVEPSHSSGKQHGLQVRCVK
jgi:uncharacterized protein (TIGR02145 family)